MEKSYIQRFQKFSDRLMDPELANHARKKGSNTFTRNRKMPLKDILLCRLSKKGLTTIFELRNYFKQKEAWPMQYSRENRERFCKSTNQHSQVGQVRALVSGMYDVLNRFYLDIETEHISISENELAKQNLSHLKNMKLKQPIIVIFERGHPAIEFVDFFRIPGNPLFVSAIFE